MNDTNRGEALLVKHNWFSTAISSQGPGLLHTAVQDTVIEGPAVVSLDNRSKVMVELDIERWSPENGSMFLTGIETREFDRLEINAPEGRYVSLRTHKSGFTTGSDKRGAHFLLSPQEIELTVSDEKPVFWVLPLSNFTIGYWRRWTAELQEHPLRIASEQCLIPFEWEGRPAFIEPLLDYQRREALLHSGDAKNLITAVMVGEVGEHPIDLDTIDTWFPLNFLRMLGFSTGIEVGAPWIEFRGASGALVKRMHRAMGAPTYTGGRCAMEDAQAPNTSKFLMAVQSVPFCQTALYRVLLHHAMRAGRDGLTIDDRLVHLFRAFDRLCQEHGFRKEFLRDLLDEPTRTCTLEIVNKAHDDVRALAAQARAAGDTNTENVLARIANRIKAADKTDRDFGRAMSKLVQHFGFHDEEVMDTHFGAFPPSPTLTTWSQVLSLYRNVAIHDGFFDTTRPEFSFDRLYSMNLHLLDLLVRILLVMSNHPGGYRPIPAILAGTNRSLHWVKPDTPARDLGYN